MAQFDLHKKIYAQMAITFTWMHANQTYNGLVIDTQGYNELEFLLVASAFDDGVHTPQLQHGDADDFSDVAVVDSSLILGGTAAAVVGDLNAPKRLGYKGNKRYVRLNIVTTGVTNGATIGAVAILGRPTVGPTANN